MKFGIRKPSIKKRIAARASVKRVLRHSLGLKAPKGFGVITNPKKAIYNKVYNQTTVDITKTGKGRKPKQNKGDESSSGCGCYALMFVVLILIVLMVVGTCAKH